MHAFFPIEWSFGDRPSDGFNGPPVEDAGTIYVARDEDSPDDWCGDGHEDEYLVLKTSLTEMIDYALEGWRGPEGFTEQIHVSASDKLAAALRAAADRLDAGKGVEP